MLTKLFRSPENHIRQLHRNLLAHLTKEERHRGAYKTLSNNVEAFNKQGESLGIVFETASPLDTPRRMEELIAWPDEQGREKWLHPLLVVAIFVAVFLEIHPIQDGNGRLSRILTTLLLLRAGYAYIPYSSLESIIEQSKESYYISLHCIILTFANEFCDRNSSDFSIWSILSRNSVRPSQNPRGPVRHQARLVSNLIPAKVKNTPNPASIHLRARSYAVTTRLVEKATA
ncbi:Fic family protein [Agrobacterium sp. CCNWLW71]|uniref:Fic family protein n=1 Tax=unclassified Agrobacterium TaxID=2632611 RepID=UPI002FEE9977